MPKRKKTAASYPDVVKQIIEDIKDDTMVDGGEMKSASVSSPTAFLLLLWITWAKWEKGLPLKPQLCGMQKTKTHGMFSHMEVRFSTPNGTNPFT
ncbi:MAG TPA: hypothetical protein ENI23_17655 [bacterium]|nr:hypothetical protein [bacterium]